MPSHIDNIGIKKLFYDEQTNQALYTGRVFCFFIALFETIMIIYALLSFDFSHIESVVYLVSYIILAVSSYFVVLFCHFTNKGICTVKQHTIRFVMIAYFLIIGIWAVVIGILDERAGNTNIVFLTIMFGVSGSIVLPRITTILYNAAFFFIFFLMHIIFVEALTLPYTFNLLVFALFIVLTSLFSYTHKIESIINQKKLHDTIESNNDLVKRLSYVNKRLAYISETDALTGTKNRTTMFNAIQANIVKQSQLNENLSVAIVDIDDFKHINDTYEHRLGDRCLERIAGILMKYVDPSMVYRYGGEEFLLILPIPRNDALILLESIRKESESSDFGDENTGNISITLSIGCYSNHPTPSSNFETYISLADKALYEAKHNGKNQIFETKQ